MSIDIKSLAIGFAKGRNSGKNPVLAELVVTENGVYDEPMIGDGPVEIAVGKTVQFKKHITMDDIPEHLRPTEGENSYGQIVRDDFTNSGYNIGAETVAIELVISEPESLAGVYGYFDEAAALAHGVTPGWNRIVDAENIESLDVPPSILVANATSAEQLSEVSFFFEGAPTPADGWNKVTVNVAGDIVDVAELPTENIEEGKIYRVTEEGVTVWMKHDDGTVETFDDMCTRMYVGMGFAYSCKYIVVDSLPDSADLETPVQDTVNKVLQDVVYVVRTTGNCYGVSVKSGVASPIDIANTVFQAPCMGVITDVSEITDTGYYTIFNENTTYGIPDEANNKTVMEHNGSEWVECGSLTGTIPVIDVLELPTENINENALYRIVSVDVFVRMFNNTMNLKEVYKDLDIHVVNTLPTEPEVFGEKMVVYILNDTGIVYVSEDGITYAALGASLSATDISMQDFGWMENEFAMTQDGVCAVRKDTKYMYHNDMFVCINEKAIPQVVFVLNDSGDGYTVNGVGKYAGDVVIPSEYNGLPVNRIGSFESCRYVSRITVPSSITAIDDEAFVGCKALYYINLNDNISIIPYRAFSGVRIDGLQLKLDSIVEIGEKAFWGSTIETLPQCPNLITIGNEAFKDCGMLHYTYEEDKVEGDAIAGRSLRGLYVPENVKTIGSSAFEHTFFPKIVFYGTPENIDATAFADCPSITDIYVPWAEGAVANAPWGATNATIYYNHTA
jgi:hypothetical protein